MISRLIVIVSIFLSVLVAGCSTVNTLEIRIESDKSLEIPSPKYLIMSDGIWAKYQDGSILITSEDLGQDIDAMKYLGQVYGNDEPTYDLAQSQRQILRKDASSIKNISTDALGIYVIDHKFGYELVVFGYKESSQIHFVTGKGVPVAPIFDSF